MLCIVGAPESVQLNSCHVMLDWCVLHRMSQYKTRATPLILLFIRGGLLTASTSEPLPACLLCHACAALRPYQQFFNRPLSQFRVQTCCAQATASSRQHLRHMQHHLSMTQCLKFSVFNFQLLSDLHAAGVAWQDAEWSEEPLACDHEEGSASPPGGSPPVPPAGLPARAAQNEGWQRIDSDEHGVRLGCKPEPRQGPAKFPFLTQLSELIFLICT